MDANNSLPSMFTDPALLYVSQRKAIDPNWIRICYLDKTKWDDATARSAYEIFRKAAIAGDAFAMCMCCRFCQAGWGCEKSNEDAFKWAENAAAQEFPPGYFELGNCYENGLGVLRNINQARHNYVIASETGFGFAAYHLATMYHAGRFGRPDMVEALGFAILADQLNEPMAPLLIANWYEAGDGVIRNEKEAVKWYMRAAELGNFFASNRLSRAYSLGELGLVRDMQQARKYEAMFDIQMQGQNKH